jgi:hypothetical protein
MIGLEQHQLAVFLVANTDDFVLTVDSPTDAAMMLIDRMAAAINRSNERMLTSPIWL